MSTRTRKKSFSKMILHFVKRLKWSFESIIMGQERIPIDLGKKY